MGKGSCEQFFDVPKNFDLISKVRNVADFALFSVCSVGPFFFQKRRFHPKRTLAFRMERVLQLVSMTAN